MSGRARFGTTDAWKIGAPVPTYVCLLFDLEEDVVIAADIIEARSKSDACKAAAKRVRDSDEAASYELWQDGVRVASGFPGKDET